MVLTGVTTTTSAGTVLSSDWATEYRCKHCNAWQEEHADGMHCLFHPTNYTIPALGEHTEYRATGRVAQVSVPLFVDTTGGTVSAGDTLTVWGVNYATVTV